MVSICEKRSFAADLFSSAASAFEWSSWFNEADLREHNGLFRKLSEQFFHIYETERDLSFECLNAIRQNRPQRRLAFPNVTYLDESLGDDRPFGVAPSPAASARREH